MGPQELVASRARSHADPGERTERPKMGEVRQVGDGELVPVEGLEPPHLLGNAF